MLTSILGYFLKTWMWVWFAKNWGIVLATMVLLLLIIAAIKLVGGDSFDKDPQLSPQEKIKSIVFLGIFIPSMGVLIPLIITYLR